MKTVTAMEKERLVLKSKRLLHAKAPPEVKITTLIRKGLNSPTTRNGNPTFASESGVTPSRIDHPPRACHPAHWQALWNTRLNATMDMIESSSASLQVHVSARSVDTDSCVQPYGNNDSAHGRCWSGQTPDWLSRALQMEDSTLFTQPYTPFEFQHGDPLTAGAEEEVVVEKPSIDPVHHPSIVIQRDQGIRKQADLYMNHEPESDTPPSPLRKSTPAWTIVKGPDATCTGGTLSIHLARRPNLHLDNSIQPDPGRPRCIMWHREPMSDITQPPLGQTSIHPSPNPHSSIVAQSDPVQQRGLWVNGEPKSDIHQSPLRKLQLELTKVKIPGATGGSQGHDYYSSIPRDEELPSILLRSESPTYLEANASDPIEVEKENIPKLLTTKETNHKVQSNEVADDSERENT